MILVPKATIFFTSPHYKERNVLFMNFFYSLLHSIFLRPPLFHGVAEAIRAYGLLNVGVCILSTQNGIILSIMD